jgi:hypothetical protein
MVRATTKSNANQLLSPAKLALAIFEATGNAEAQPRL